ncbi:hypothetical protein HDU97_004674 [Phlyctochytrium planicorne]|nr:hypothetical protein HDU97_004674 [Phlyctochytrium planicorne]
MLPSTTGSIKTIFMAALMMMMMMMVIVVKAQDPTTSATAIAPSDAVSTSVAAPTSAAATATGTGTGNGTGTRSSAPTPTSLTDILSGLTNFANLTTCATGCLGNLVNVISVVLSSDKLSQACLDPATTTTLAACKKTCPDDNNLISTIQNYCATVPKPSPLATARATAISNDAVSVFTQVFASSVLLVVSSMMLFAIL